MCRIQCFKYTKCGHFFCKIISTCGGTTTHTSRAGITKASCRPSKSMKKTKAALVIHYPQMCAHCSKDAIKAGGQQQVDAIKAHVKLVPLKVLKRQALQAERKHQEMCTVLDQMVNIAAPVAKRDIKLPSPPMRKAAVEASPLKNEVKLGMPVGGHVFEETNKKPAATIASVRPKLTLRLRQSRRTILEQKITNDFQPCKNLAGGSQASLGKLD